MRPLIELSYGRCRCRECFIDRLEWRWHLAHAVSGATIISFGPLLSVRRSCRRPTVGIHGDEPTARLFRDGRMGRRSARGFRSLQRPATQRSRDRKRRAGKTTLIDSLARLLPSAWPVLVLDDGEELDLSGPLHELIHLRRADGVESTRGAEAEAIRGAPRRLVLGNVCPPGAGEVLRALVSDRHHGSLLAMGATSTEAALRQLATWSLADGFSWCALTAWPTAIAARSPSLRRTLRSCGPA